MHLLLQNNMSQNTYLANALDTVDARCADPLLGPSLRVPGSLLGDLHALAQPLLQQQQRRSKEASGEDEDADMDQTADAGAAEQPLSAQQIATIGGGTLLLRCVQKPCNCIAALSHMPVCLGDASHVYSASFMKFPD